MTPKLSLWDGSSDGVARAVSDWLSGLVSAGHFVHISSLMLWSVANRLRPRHIDTEMVDIEDVM